MNVWTEDLESQLKAMERKANEYEKLYLKSFDQADAPAEYRKYLLETLQWNRNRITALFGIKFANLHKDSCTPDLPVSSEVAGFSEVAELSDEPDTTPISEEVVEADEVVVQEDLPFT